MKYDNSEKEVEKVQNSQKLENGKKSNFMNTSRKKQIDLQISCHRYGYEEDT